MTVPSVDVQPLPAPAAGPSFAARTVDKSEVRAALLVPLSGTYAAWGQALSNAAQMALFEVADPHFSLIPLDTKGTAEGAAAAAKQAVAQGAHIILGPIFSPEVKAVGPLAREQNIPVLAFTTDRSAVGQGVYALGILPGSQVSRVVGHARSQGKERFAILARNDEYGHAVAEAFQSAVAAQGGTLIKAEYYDPQATDFTSVVRSFTGAQPRTGSSRTAQPERQAPFDAVMLPDDGVRLRTIASLITYFDVDPGQVRFLGTMLWEDPRLASDLALQGGWYAAPPTSGHQNFESRYVKSFGPLPARVSALASIAYDATALAAVLARQGSGDYPAAALINPNGFAGVDGLFRLLPDGSSERGLAVRELNRDGVREVSPAPSTFSPPAF